MSESSRDGLVLGQFWDPTSDGAEHPGLLHGLDTDRPMLSLLSAFPGAAEGWEVDQTYPVLCGRGRGGAPEVTLIDCHSLTRAPGSSQDLWCQRVLTGAALKPDEMAFTWAGIQTSHLMEWAQGAVDRVTGSRDQGMNELIASADIPGAVVELRAGKLPSWDSRGTRETRYAQLGIQFDPPASLPDVDRRLQQILRMLTFVTARANYYQRFTLSTGNRNTLGLEVSGRSSFYRLGQEAEVQPFPNMLLDMHRQSFDFGDFVPSWIELDDRLGRSAPWIFAAYYDDDASIEERFQSAAQALEAAHEQLTPADPSRAKRARAVADALELKGEFTQHLKTVKGLVRSMLFQERLEQRYRAVLERVNEFAIALVPDQAAFALRCAALRNYYAHWSDPRKPIVIPDVDDLWDLAQRLKLILEAYLLSHLGYEPADVLSMNLNRPAFIAATRREKSELLR